MINPSWDSPYPDCQAKTQSSPSPWCYSMRWTESPLWFSAMTETVTDLVNDYLSTVWDPPVHHLEHLAMTPLMPFG